MCARRMKRGDLLPHSRVCGIYDSRCAGRFDVLKSFFKMKDFADILVIIPS